jgi:predicted nuclease of predicted toxin-antitoxin system
MANLYADENFPYEVVETLRQLGHDVVTAREAGQANQKIPDPQVLAFAVSLGRAVLTLNRRHYIKLHKQTRSHMGIVICTYDDDYVALAQRIHQALLAETSLDNKLLRINKPNRP